ncbi:phage tail tube protein [Pantoea ananatis]|uniref:phage tail tube protein n=1 Tax=Pantoea ananas TaxID=553 RepID=UPI00188ECD09|nr:phage tail tube protein [Pantoea ananatis]
MAFNIQSGANITASIGTAGTTESTTFTEIPELASFTTSGGTSTVIDVVTFNSPYNRKLLGTKSVADISITVNYIADNSVHQQLVAANEAQSRIQLKLQYFQDATKTTGFYVVYNGFVSGDQLAGDKDSVVTREFSFAVDGGPVASGIINK